MKAWALLACGAVALAGCRSMMNPGSDMVPPKPFTGTKWTMQLDVPVPGEQPYLVFGDGQMEGFGGCNKIEGRYVQDTVGARAIVMGRIQAGFKSCESRAQVAERRLLEIVQAASSYSVTADELTMSGSAGTLKFRSDPPYPAKH
jgi:heat shock protein HslJ